MTQLESIAVDSSALVAILTGEPEGGEFNRCISAAARRVISAASLLETRIVIYARHGDAGDVALQAFMAKAAIEIIEVDALIADLAFDAYRRYGKGVGNPAVLNFGDLFTYALAKKMNCPVLFKGGDFSQTDAESAILSKAYRDTRE